MIEGAITLLIRSLGTIAGLCIIAYGVVSASNTATDNIDDIEGFKRCSYRGIRAFMDHEDELYSPYFINHWLIKAFEQYDLWMNGGCKIWVDEDN